MATSERHARWARRWDENALMTDVGMRVLDRALFRDTRDWLCRQAEGEVLEVGIGSGLNLSRYPPGVTIAGIDLSPAMVGLAQARAAALGLEVRLDVGDAQALPWRDAAFDSVTCTFALCGIPDHRRALVEMIRVLLMP